MIRPMILARRSVRGSGFLQEAYYLYYQEDLDKEHTLNGVKGVGFKNCDYFLPYAGTMSKTDGTISMKNSYGAYWLDGESYEGDRSIYV